MESEPSAKPTQGATLSPDGGFEPRHTNWLAIGGPVLSIGFAGVIALVVAVIAIPLAPWAWPWFLLALVLCVAGLFAGIYITVAPFAGWPMPEPRADKYGVVRRFAISGTAALIVAVVVATILSLRAPVVPKPTVSLECQPDTRIGVAVTESGEPFPPKIYFFTDAVVVMVPVGNIDNHALDGSIFQLSTAGFQRCTLVGNEVGWNDVVVTFEVRFRSLDGATYKPPIPVPISLGHVSPDETTHFGVANFSDWQPYGPRLMVGTLALKEVTYRIAPDSPVQNTVPFMSVGTIRALSVPLRPQYHSKYPFRHFSKCHYGGGLLKGFNPPPECSLQYQTLERERLDEADRLEYERAQSIQN